MQPDSHRARLVFDKEDDNDDNTPQAVNIPTVKMPCPRSSRCSKPLTFTADDGTEMESWWSIRRSNVRSMRKMVKRVVLYMALIEAIRIGPDVLVFAGQNGYPERGCDDFGIAYWTGYVLSWLYLCVFTIVWKPLFSNDEDGPGTMDKVASVLRQLNMFLLPMSIGLSLAEYTYFLVNTLIYVEARPVDSWSLPANTKRNWLARGALLLGILLSMTGGHAMFRVLAESGLARVKCIEYMVIVVPIQINLGLLLGSLMQWKGEQRAERKKAAIAAVVLVEDGTVDEKEQLLA